MRKKDTTHREEFIGPNVKLTKEDLEEILDTFNQNLQNIIIEDEAKIYDSLDDLEQYRGKNIGHLIIGGQGPFTFFEINNPKNGRVRLFTEDSNPWAHDGFHKLIELINKRKYFTTNGDGTWGVIFSTLTFTLLLALTGLQRINIILSLILFVVFFMIVGIVSSKIHYGRFNYVTLNRRHELPRFWSANKNTILTGIIGSVIGAGLALLVAYLLYRFKIK